MSIDGRLTLIQWMDAGSTAGRRGQPDRQGIRMTADETSTFNAICDEMLGMLRQIRADLAEIRASMERTQHRLDMMIEEPTR